MAHRIMLRRWVPGDMEGIANFWAANSPETARRFLHAVRPTLAFLGRFPGAGSPKASRRKSLEGIRTWPVDGFHDHLIYYRPIRTE